MNFSDIKPFSDALKSETKVDFDIDKRAEISPGRGFQADNKFDIDKRAEIPQIHNTIGELTRLDAEKQKGEPIQNKIDGLEREKNVKEELDKKYIPEDGYTVLSEAYLRDSNGKIVKDPISGEARRVDFVVVKDKKVVDSVEVTSPTADKTEQINKEQRIRENGGNYVKMPDGSLAEYDDKLKTRIERRD